MPVGLQVIVGAFALAVAQTSAAAQAPSTASPYLWPVAGLYGLDSSACSPADREPTAAVATDLCAALSPVARQQLGNAFVELVKSRFPNVEAGFADHLPASATPRARLNSTLVASLRLTRAQIWEVPKGAGIDGYLPVTLTLDITNADTGEVLFSRTRTDVGHGSYAASRVRSAMAAQLPQQLRTTMTALVDSAAGEWRPFGQSATVIGKAGDDWVLDAGRSKGFRTGDQVGDAEVLFSAADYSVVKPVLGDLHQGQILSRTVATPVALLARPTILSTMLDGPSGQAQYLSEIFDDAVAAKAGFAPVPVNPSFEDLRSNALSAAEDVARDSRSLPDYVAAFTVVELQPSRFASNIPDVEIARYQAHAFVSLVDRSGRVVYTADGIGRIDDKIAHGIAFDEGQRQDTAVRNALTDAATKLAAFKPQPIEIPVADASGRVLVKDNSGAVPTGAQLTVLRPAGTIKGVRVLVPVGEITTSEVRQDGLLAEVSGVQELTPHEGDVAVLESSGRPLQSRAPILRCGGSQSVDDRGTVPFPLFGAGADNLFAAQFAGPVYLAQLPGKLSFAKSAFGDGWSSFQPAKPIKAAVCFTPVISVSAAALSNGKPQRALTIGFTVFRDGQKIGGFGAQASFTQTAAPADAPQGATDALLQQDLAEVALPLAEKAAAKVTIN